LVLATGRSVPPPAAQLTRPWARAMSTARRPPRSGPGDRARAPEAAAGIGKLGVALGCRGHPGGGRGSAGKDCRSGPSARHSFVSRPVAAATVRRAGHDPSPLPQPLSVRPGCGPGSGAPARHESRGDGRPRRSRRRATVPAQPPPPASGRIRHPARRWRR
jgi:hypothetical protein